MTADISTKWRDLFDLIPGYDPIATAAPGEWFDAEWAEYVLEFIETCCHHVKGEWARTHQTLKLEPWQQAWIGCLFGWRRANGTRRYREAFVFIPRKNAKTTAAAAVVCAVGFLDDEPGAEMYSTAAEREQARLCFEITAGMIRAEPHMKEAADIFKYSIVIGDKSYKAVSAEAGSKHGFNPHLVVNDELHAHKSPDLTEAMASGMGARRQPILLHITTSDYEREGSVCNERHDYACKVRDGMVPDSAFLPVIYEASRDDDWTDEATWAKANPNLGVSVDIDYLRTRCLQAQESPVKENEFKRWHLNIRTEQAVRWLPMDKWDACERVTTADALLGKQCFAGLDLSATTDMTALVLLYELPDGHYFALPYFWLPEATLRDRSNRNHEAYQSWHADGLLQSTPGDMIDYALIRRDVNGIAKARPIRQLAVDRLFQGAQLATELREEDGLDVVSFGQGFMSMAAPTLEFERLVIGGKLDHGGNAILRWMAANAAVKIDPAGNMKPNKAESWGKIDGIVCAIMALGLATATPEQQESMYAKGPRVIRL